MVNNVCPWLIVYGTYSPGGVNHGIFAGLPGEWRKGKILCSLMDPPDGIGPGESDEVEAWTINFSDCAAELFTPEYEVQKRLLYERWTGLDRAMGPGWVRSQDRWWPEGSEPVAGRNGMIVVNIYVPLKHFAYLAEQEDAPSPDEEDDFYGMWAQVIAGKKRYEPSAFISLVKDATPQQYANLFRDLPGGEEFIGKLHRFYQEHQKGSGNLLCDGESDSFSLYVCPLDKHALVPDDLIALVKSEIASRAALLRTAGFEDEAETLDSLTFEYGRPPPKPAADSRAADALMHASDIIATSMNVEEHWVYCLREACYGIAASYELVDWLMSHWYRVDLDFEPTYLLWKAGGGYEIKGDTCHVYRSASEA